MTEVDTILKDGHFFKLLPQSSGRYFTFAWCSDATHPLYDNSGIT